MLFKLCRLFYRKDEDAVKIQEIVISGSERNNNAPSAPNIEFSDIYSHIHRKEPKLNYDENDYD